MKQAVGLGWTTLALLALGCGGGQVKKGAAYCESYEANFVTMCRQECEANGAEGDGDVIAKCEKECAGKLSEDDIFEDSCPDDAARAAKRGGKTPAK